MKSFRKYGIALALGVLIFGLYWLSYDLPENWGAYELISKIANALTLPGVLLSAAGALTWCASKGTFDIFSYGASMLFGRFLPLGKKNVFHSGEKYYDYVQRKREERSPWLVETLLVGLGFLAAAIVFVVVSELI